MSDKGTEKEPRKGGKSSPIQLKDGTIFQSFKEMANSMGVHVRPNQSAHIAVDDFLKKNPDSKYNDYEVISDAEKSNQYQNPPSLAKSENRNTETSENKVSPDISNMAEVGGKWEEKSTMKPINELDDEETRLMSLMAYASSEKQDIWIKINAEKVLPQLLRLQAIGIKMEEILDVRLDDDVA